MTWQFSQHFFLKKTYNVLENKKIWDWIVMSSQLEDCVPSNFWAINKWFIFSVNAFNVFGNILLLLVFLNFYILVGQKVFKIFPSAYHFVFIFSGYCCRVICFISKAVKEGELELFLDHFGMCFYALLLVLSMELFNSSSLCCWYSLCC